ncbi:28S rRNA (cytosine-C(5))-methyltransferase [Malaya genurostris]|uniref:28S rRNA (cytosine-C(5))-methyltransferase n=1 Tax=Malaya genurostris TaxID=325434 RepID=UPI0026F3E5B4|nr:28S rRNA (cytosine-C(5))-methyltransferase [Malaya genurostris]
MVAQTSTEPTSGNQQNQRRHSIPVPTNYRSAAKILRLVVEERRNVKSLVLEDKHLRKGKGLAIMDLILVNLKQIDDLIARTELMQKKPKLSPWLAKVLIAELIFGRGELNGESLPVQCVRRYKEALQDALSKSDVAPAKLLDFKEPRYVRINTSVLAQPGAIRLLQEEGWILVDEEFPSYASFLDRVKNLNDSEFLVDFHFKEVLVFPNSAKNYWARATELKQKFVLQNKACVLPTYLLSPVKKSVVLDMCAAPGLKTTHLANLMKNKGRIYAIERDANRYKVLCDYSAEFGVIKTIHDDCLQIGDEQAPGVEYILIDPSCSGSGMVDRLKLNEEIDKQRLYKLGGLQYKLLCHAMNAFPAAKRIVYSTCSVYPEENEEIVQSALKHNGHFKLVDARAMLDKEWLNFGSPDYAGVGEKCLYARPETDLTIGMFVAVFERCDENEYNEIFLAHEKQKESYEKLSKIGQFEFGRTKKAKKRKLEASTSTEMTQDSERQEELCEETPADGEGQVLEKKKKKKSKKKDVEELATEVFVKTPLLQDEQVPPKKKKKSKKISDDEAQLTLTAVIVENGNGVDIKDKDKKKHKIKSIIDESGNPEENSPLDEESVVEKKKKKSKHREQEELSLAEEVKELSPTVDDISKSKKKKKKDKVKD